MLIHQVNASSEVLSLGTFHHTSHIVALQRHCISESVFASPLEPDIVTTSHTGMQWFG